MLSSLNIILVIILLLLSFVSLNAQIKVSDLVINEFLASNKSINQNHLGEYEDWIELYNNSDSTIDLSQVYLSDNFEKLKKFKFPNGSKIAAKSSLIIWADDNQADTVGFHTNFKISASGGESIILSNANGTIIDSVSFSMQEADISFGRCPNGVGKWKTHDMPTFNSINLCNDILISVYPNPANSIVNFEFSLAESDVYEVKILDALGNLAYYFVKQHFDANIYTYNWNKVLLNGKQATKGAFYFQVKSAKTILTKAFIIENE